MFDASKLSKLFALSYFLIKKNNEELVFTNIKLPGNAWMHVTTV